ncbi:hypothetical protein ACB092_03G055900 [Castanea dentata]
MVEGNNQENIILIYKDVKKLWDKWNIRSFVLLSLFLQRFFAFYSFPEKEDSKEMAYLLADWAASFAVGLVFDSEEKYTSGPDKVDNTGFLLVLWVPFLLLTVDGQDGITSFAVQDNELWLRHLIWLILQVATTGFVFFQSVHQNRLWIPTLLLLLAGTIKYSERTIALYLASSDSLGTSVLEPNPGPDYERLMRTYSHYEASNVPVQFVLSDEKKSQDYLSYNVMEHLRYYHRFANMYKGLIVNLMFRSREHGEDLLHTKVVVANSNLGQLVRRISFGLVVAALSLFHKEDKHGLKSFDVRLTYTLFFGVLGLDMVIHLLWMFYDWTIASCFKYVDDPEEAKRISSARGKWVLEDCNFDYSELMSYCLSDYMMYLLYQQPSLMSEVSGIAKQRFMDTLAEAQRFFSQRRRPGQLRMDYQRILDVDTRFKPAHVKGNISKSALFDASTLAKELKKLGTQKWEVTRKVWVELLSYAASHSRGNGHVQQLSKGGELLITFVWLLMAPLGLRESWVETRIRTKLIVGK